jgi:hypothetical protein
MAYAPANLLLLKEITAPLHWKMWLYASADSFTTFKAANYISNPLQMGVAVNDLIIVLDTTTPAMTLSRVLTVTATTCTTSETGTPVVS